MSMSKILKGNINFENSCSALEQNFDLDSSVFIFFDVYKMRNIA